MCNADRLVKLRKVLCLHPVFHSFSASKSCGLYLSGHVRYSRAAANYVPVSFYSISQQSNVNVQGAPLESVRDYMLQMMGKDTLSFQLRNFGLYKESGLFYVPLKETDYDSLMKTYPNISDYINFMVSMDYNAPDMVKLTELRTKARAALCEISDDQLIQFVSIGIAKISMLRKSILKPKKGYDFWTVFDEEFLKRALENKQWRSRVHFQMADVLATTRLSAFSNFYWNLLKHLFRKVDSLSREEFVCLCNIMFHVRSIPKAFPTYNVEYNLPRILRCRSDSNEKMLHLHEVSIICRFFAKHKLSFHDEGLVEVILGYLLHKKSVVTSIDLSTICKSVTRSNARRSAAECAKEVVGAFISEIPRLDMVACIGLCNLCVRFKLADPEFHNALCNKLMSEDLISARLKPKDVKTLVTYLAMDNVKSQKALEKLIGYIESNHKNHEYSYGKILASILNEFAIANIYPVELIQNTLSADYIKETYGKSIYQYDYELLRVNENIQVDVPSYKGPFLTDRARCYLLKRWMRWVSDRPEDFMSWRERFARDVIQSLAKAWNCSPDFFYLCSILPHHRTYNIVFVTDSHGVLREIPSNLKSTEFHLPKNVNPIRGEEAFNPHAVILYTSNYTFHNANEITGNGHYEIRQIKRMGYHAHLVSHLEWKTLNTCEERSSYLNRTLRIRAEISN